VKPAAPDPLNSNLNLHPHLNLNRFILLILLSPGFSAAAQETSPAPSAAALPVPSVVFPAASPTASPPASPTPTPSLLKKTGVKIQFLPPPMEGTISLGIYDHTGKLVRILHRAATGDEFVAALDGYITHWDGLDDAGQPMPPGHYSARGYMVGGVTVHRVDLEAPALSGSNIIPAASSTPGGPTESAPPDALMASSFACKFSNGKPFIPKDKIRVALVSNPLDRDRAGSADLSVGFDATGSWLQLSDGLPLKQISATPNLKWAVLGRSAPGEPLVVFQSDVQPLDPVASKPGGDGIIVSFPGINLPKEYTITKVSDMMAFDCGGFDFAGPAK
jgi:hypothetical protein